VTHPAYAYSGTSSPSEAIFVVTVTPLEKVHDTVVSSLRVSPGVEVKQRFGLRGWRPSYEDESSA
jgi:hypothetical protein